MGYNFWLAIALPSIAYCIYFAVISLKKSKSINRVNIIVLFVAILSILIIGGLLSAKVFVAYLYMVVISVAFIGISTIVMGILSIMKKSIITKKKFKSVFITLIPIIVVFIVLYSIPVIRGPLFFRIAIPVLYQKNTEVFPTQYIENELNKLETVDRAVAYDFGINLPFEYKEVIKKTEFATVIKISEDDNILIFRYEQDGSALISNEMDINLFYKVFGEEEMNTEYEFTKKLYEVSLKDLKIGMNKDEIQAYAYLLILKGDIIITVPKYYFEEDNFKGFYSADEQLGYIVSMFLDNGYSYKMIFHGEKFNESTVLEIIYSSLN